MIITKNKPIDEIVETLNGAKKVFLLGCSLCATTCKTGGEKDLERLTAALAENGIKVDGAKVFDAGCNKLEVKRFFRESKDELKRCEAVIAFTCGGGTQTA